MFGAMSIYGYKTKNSLAGLGSFAMMGLIGILIASIVNIFLQSSMIQFITSCVGVIAFTGIIAYDTKKLKSVYYSTSDESIHEKLVIIGAIELYFNVINLFMRILYLTGNRQK
jgi:FtsH-binding integral membrane protein